MRSADAGKRKNHAKPGQRRRGREGGEQAAALDQVGQEDDAEIMRHGATDRGPAARRIRFARAYQAAAALRQMRERLRGALAPGSARGIRAAPKDEVDMPAPDPAPFRRRPDRWRPA